MNLRTTINRLNKLADHLLTKVKPEEFYMPHWFVETKCKTAACAFGHACSIPSFRRAGLKINRYEDYVTPVFDGESGFEAAAKFFGISRKTSEYLFDAEAYDKDGSITRHNVVRRIRAMVKKLGVKSRNRTGAKNHV